MSAFLKALVVIVASVIGLLAALLCAACALPHGASDPLERRARALTGLRSLLVFALCALATACAVRRAMP